MLFHFLPMQTIKKHGPLLFKLITEAFDCRYHNYKVKPM